MLNSVLNDFSVLKAKRSSAAKKRIAIVHLSRVSLEATVVMILLGFILHSRVENFDVIGSVDEVIMPTAHAAEIEIDNGSVEIYAEELLPLTALLETNIVVSSEYDKDMAKMNEVRWAAKQVAEKKALVERENTIEDIELAKSASGRMMIAWNEEPGVKYSIYQKSNAGGYVRINEVLFEGGVYNHNTSEKDASYIVMKVSATGDEKNVLGVRYNYYE
jgi:hypothetical protein